MSVFDKKKKISRPTCASQSKQNRLWITGILYIYIIYLQINTIYVNCMLKMFSLINLTRNILTTW